MTKEEFLKDLIDYYSVNPLERRNGSEPYCTYAPKTTLTEGCAIGRHLQGTFEEKKTWDKIDASYTDIVKELLNEDTEIKDLRPEWMKAMDINFLQNCQGLHDSGSCWTDEGLSEYGKVRVNDIISFYDLEMEPYEV